LNTSLQDVLARIDNAFASTQRDDNCIDSSHLLGRSGLLCIDMSYFISTSPPALQRILIPGTPADRKPAAAFAPRNPPGGHDTDVRSTPCS
jgi:hypothetical protein